MRYTPITAALAALAMLPAAAQAQDHHGSKEQPPADAAPEASATGPVLSAEQRAGYAAWPENVKAYYQTLSAERQATFWSLPDSDKVALATMSTPDAEAAWQMAERKAAPQPEPADPMDPQPKQ